MYKLTITLIYIILFTLQNTFWFPSLSLTLYDKDVIEGTDSEGLLSEKHMLAANQIFANQFPKPPGSPVNTVMSVRWIFAHIC